MEIKQKNDNEKKHGFVKNKKAIKAPDLAEMQRFQEPHNNNLFRLQIDGILEEIQVPEKEMVQVQSWLHKFTLKVKEIPESKAFKLNDFSWVAKKKLEVPLDLTLFASIQGEFQFEPPTDVSVCGSFSSRTCLKKDRSIDIMLMLSRNIVNKSDLNNGVWLLKRALYLAWLAKALNDSGNYTKMEWILQFDDPLRPVLQLRDGESCQKWTMNIFPVPPHNHIKFAKIGPLRNNVDSSWFFDKKWVEEKTDTTPTPYINWLLGIDLLMKNHSELIAKDLVSENLRKGIKLIKVWCNQRNYNQGNSYLNGHVITMYVLYLLKTRTLSGQMSPYIVFRTTLLAMIKESWVEDGPSFITDWNREYKKEDFQRTSEVVFIEPNGYLNLTTPMLAEVFCEIQKDCSKVIKSLEHVTDNTFEDIFIVKIDDEIKWDEIVHVKLSQEKMKLISKSDEDKAYVLNHFGAHPKRAWLEIASVIKLGLEGRINCLSYGKKSPRKFGYASSPALMNTNMDIHLSYNESYTDLLTKGPPGDSSEAKDFRKFWGEQAKLWRLPDGSLHEIAAWGEGSDPMFLRRRIPLKIIRYLLKTYHKITESDVNSFEKNFESVLMSPIVFDGAKPNTGDESVTSCIQLLDDFKKFLDSNSSNIPLKIKKIVPSSHKKKYSSVFPPVPLSCASNGSKKGAKITSPEFVHYRESIGMIMFFESSNKWADEILPLRALKVEFMCALADVLEKNEYKTIVFRDHMDIFWKGYIINLKIGILPEIGLLRKLKESNPDASDIEDPLDMEMEIDFLPLLTSHLMQLRSLYPNYTNSVRLSKRWISSQLLCPYFPPLLVELLVAHIFLNCKSYDSSRSARAGFLRFLHLLSRADWKATPFILNFGDTLTENDHQAISSVFESQRESFPNVFIFTSCEKTKIKSANSTEDMTVEEIQSVLPFSKKLTGDSPILPILARAKTLAKATLQLYQSKQSNFSIDVKSLFRPSYEGFDIIINLRPEAINRRNEAIDFVQTKTESPYKSSDLECVPASDFDTASKYVEDLRTHYGEHFLFLHDPHGGARIAVVLKPTASKSENFKAFCLDGHKLHNGDTEQILNLEAIIQDFKVLGSHICKSVVTKSL